MSYISDIFDRLNLQQIREFLLHGVECIDLSDKSYKQRLSEAEKTAIDLIIQHFPNMKEYEKITTEVYNYGTASQNVFMEIGLQCGMLLALQLFPSVLKEYSDPQ